ncbi:hypothetical protein ACOMHN_038243 [Nucella lapillus]
MEHKDIDQHFDTEWLGKEQSDTEWCGKEQRDTEWCGKEQSDTEWCGKEQSDTEWCGKEQHDIDGGGKEQRDTDGGGKEQRDTDGGGKEQRDTDGGGKEQRDTDGSGKEQRDTDGSGKEQRDTDGSGKEQRDTDGSGKEQRDTDGSGKEQRDTDGSGKEQWFDTQCYDTEHHDTKCHAIEHHDTEGCDIEQHHDTKCHAIEHHDTEGCDIEQHHDTEGCDIEHYSDAQHYDKEQYHDGEWNNIERDNGIGHESTGQISGTGLHNGIGQYDLPERHLQCGIQQETCSEHHNPEQSYGREVIANVSEGCDIEQHYQTKQPYRTMQQKRTEHQSGRTVLLDLNGGYVDVVVDDDDNSVSSADRDGDDDQGYVNSEDEKNVNRGKEHDNDKLMQGRKNADDLVADIRSNERDFTKGVRDNTERSVSGSKDDPIKVCCDRSETELVTEHARKDMPDSVCQLKDSHPENWNTKTSSIQDEETDTVIDRNNCVSQTGGECSDNISHINNNGASLTQNHNNITTTRNEVRDNSECVTHHGNVMSFVRDGCEKPQHPGHEFEDESSVPRKAFSNNSVRSPDVGNCPGSESLENSIVSNGRACRTCTENNNIQITTNTNSDKGVSNNDGNINTDNQSDSLKMKTQPVPGNGNEDNLFNSKETGDVSTTPRVEPSSDNSSSPTKKAPHGHRWTPAFAFSFLRKTLHNKSKAPKDVPPTVGTISDKLPDVTHEGILHTGRHDNPTPQKKLTFQIPDPEEPTINGTTIIHAHHRKSTPSTASFKKLSQRFPFRALSKTGPKKNSDMSQLRVNGHNTLGPNTLSDQPSGDQNSSQSHQQARESIPNRLEKRESDRRCHKPDSQSIPKSSEQRESDRESHKPNRQSIPKRPEKRQSDRKPKRCLPLWEKLHKWWRSGSSIEGKEIRNTLVVGVAFQLIFTAHFAIQNLQSSLHEEEYLGVSALGCLYATSIFSSIFAPTIIGLLGLKGCLVLAWLTHMLYTLAQFYPTWQTMVPASVLLGALTGPTWTAQGVYVSACAFSFSRRSPHSPYTILSRFNGLFFTMYETRQMLGNILSSIVLRHGVGNRSQEIIFKYCGHRDCPASENVTNIEEPEAMVIHSMLAIYIALQVVALLLTIVFLTPLSQSEWWSRAPIRETAISWFKTLVGTRMGFLVPFLVFQAIQQGMLLSEYTKSYISCPIGIHMVGFVMATHGATSAMFVYIFSRLARRTGRYPLFALAAVLTLCLLVVLYDWTPREDQQALIFVFPIIWGIGEGIWQTQTNSMIAVMFWKRKESAFANYQTWRAVGFTFIFSFHSVLCVHVKIAITITLLIVGMILYTAVEIHGYRKERRFSSSSFSSSSSSNLPKEDATHSSATSPPTLSVTSSLGVKLEHGLEARADVELGTVPTSVRRGVSAKNSSTMFRLFKFQDDGDLESGGHVTLDGTYLSRGESAFLDNDLQRYGVLPSGGTRPLSHAHLAKSCSEDCERWVGAGEEDGGGIQNSGSGSDDSAANQCPTRPHMWQENSAFEDEGELRVLRTKNDVLVY